MAKNIKVILLTGTVESDKAKDFPYVMNLILPEGEQLPLENKYEKLMFNDDGIMTEEGKKVFSKAVTGRVSFLRAIEADTTVIEDGQTNPWKEGKKKEWENDTGVYIEKDDHPWTRFTKIKPLKMSKFQSDKVIESSSRKDFEDKTTKKQKEGVEGGAFRKFEKDASVFVWPSGLYGKQGFEDGIVTSGGMQSVLAKAGGKSTSSKIYKFKRESDRTKIKNNLGEYSAKFAEIVDIVSHAIDSKGKVFIFAPDIHGNGLILLGLILELVLNFNKIDNKINLKSANKGRRYMIVSSETAATGHKVTELLENFNDPLNSKGEYIPIIMGTERLAEGITLLGIRHFISFKHEERRDFVAQVEKRGVRVGSHLQLEPAERSIVIHRLVVAYTEDEQFSAVPTVDIETFQKLEKKYYQIKQQRRLRKIHSVDCVWNYARNVQENDKNFSEECDGEECNYICSESPLQYINKNSKIWKYEYPKDYIDYNNYNILYSQKEQEKIIYKLRELFQKNYKFSYDELLKELEEHNENLIMQTLSEIIDNFVPMYSRYGTFVYLQEDNGIFYTGLAGGFDGQSSNLYISNNKNLDDLNILLEEEELSSIAQEFCNSETDDERIEVVKNSSGNVLQTFVETFFLAVQEGKKFSTKLTNFFNNFVYQQPDKNLVHILETDKYTGSTYQLTIIKKKLEVTGKMKYLDSNGVWMYCSIFSLYQKFLLFLYIFQVCLFFVCRLQM